MLVINSFFILLVGLLLVWEIASVASSFPNSNRRSFSTSPSFNPIIKQQYNVQDNYEEELKLLYPVDFDFRPFHSFSVSRQSGRCTGRSHSIYNTRLPNIAQLKSLNSIVRMKTGVDADSKSKEIMVKMTENDELLSVRLYLKNRRRYLRRRQRVQHRRLHHPLDSDDDEILADPNRPEFVLGFVGHFSPLSHLYYYNVYRQLINEFPRKPRSDPDLNRFKQRLIAIMTPELKHYYNMMFYHYQIYYAKQYTCQERLKRFLLWVYVLNQANHFNHIDPNDSGSTPESADR